jgi:ankyrin repeat protein
MVEHKSMDYGYHRLMEAAVFWPHTVPQLIKEEPELLQCKNYSGETVMHWFVVENNTELVELLCSCGGQVSDYALTEACSLGHVDMVYLLLGIGVTPNIESCLNNIKLGHVPRKTVAKLKRAFNRYGYNLAVQLSA